MIHKLKFNKNHKEKRKLIGVSYNLMTQEHKNGFCHLYYGPERVQNYMLDLALDYIQSALLITFAPRFETI